MKKLLIVFLSIFLTYDIQAQLSNGSVAPDFTLTDLNGTTHNLYNLLDQGYTVYIDFSAIWCPPCWNYHNSGALEDLYINHGPVGYPNVSANTTDDVMVFFIEGQQGTLAELNGGAGSQGDWVTGTPYPIIPTYPGTNSTQVTSDYQIGYWPTIYMVCPDRLITEIGQAPTPYSFISTCPPPASYNDDVNLFDYSGQTLTCDGDITPEITIQNYGFSNLTTLTIDVSVNGMLASSILWTGNLSTYDTEVIALNTLNGLLNGDVISITVSGPNGGVDGDPSNNPPISFNAVLATQNAHTDVTVQIVTDAYGAETTWDITDANGMVVLAGGPYGNLGAAGTTIQTPVSATLAANTCYTFTIYDSYGDGINSGYGVGSFTVTDANGVVLASGGVFTYEDGAMWKTDVGIVSGCTDPTAFNYDPTAIVDDGSCCYNPNGCICSHSNNSNNFENGRNISSSIPNAKLAVDIIINPNETFILSNAIVNVFNSPGEFIQSIDITYHEDNFGFPGSVIGSETIVPSSEVYLGSNYGLDLDQVVLDLSAFAFNGQNGTKYWISLSGCVLSGGGASYWETATNSVVGDSVRSFWNGFWEGYAEEGVYYFEGQCIDFAQKTFVPDDNFENYLEANGMGDGIALNDSVLTSNINTVTFLDVSLLNIADLTGIEDFISLTSLLCYNNMLSSLDVSNNLSLQSLHVFGNNLTSLDVSNNTALTTLKIGSFLYYPGVPVGSVSSGNNISALDLSNNINLVTLECLHNNLLSLDVSSNTALVTLNCGINQFDSLDVSNNTLLSWLTCRANNLTYLNTNGAVSLTELRVWDNQLTTLDLSTNNNLTNLYLQNNQLTSLDVSNCTSLKELRCDYNNLTSLDIRNNNNQNMTGAFGPGPYGCCYGNSFNNNPLLFCINVSDSTWATNNWTVVNTTIDPQHYFSFNCIVGGGCTDSTACNYDSLATIDDGSCLYLSGCMDDLACNYDPVATCDDGSCIYVDNPIVDMTIGSWWMEFYDLSCSNLFISFDTAIFYVDGTVYFDNGFITQWSMCGDILTIPDSYPGAFVQVQFDSSNGLFTGYYYSNNVAVHCVTLGPNININYGCTDPTADNYDPNATIDDGSCTYCLSLTISSVITSDVSCNGGSDGDLTITISGGTSPYFVDYNNFSPTSIVGDTMFVFSYLPAGAGNVSVIDYNGCVITTNILINEPTPIVSNLNVVDPICFGDSDGFASVSPGGGTPGYSYLWWNGSTLPFVAGLPAAIGQYWVNITDANGCSHFEFFDVNDPSPIVANVISTDAICYGSCNGTALLSVSGGNAPYTYSYSNGQAGPYIINLCAGVYTCTILDANGCSANTSVIINEPSPLLATATSNDVSSIGACDGSTSVNPIGGTGPYNVLWSNGQSGQVLTNLCPGLYTYVVTDFNGCQISGFITVNEPCIITGSISSSPPTQLGACDGFAVVIPSSGIAPYSYQWTDTLGNIFSNLTLAQNLCTGVYFVSITDSVGCNYLDTLILGNIEGCTDPLAPNYYWAANIDDGSCIVYGCTDSTAYNYNILANSDNGSCLYCDLDVNLFIVQNSGGQCNGWVFIDGYSSNTPIQYSMSGVVVNSFVNSLCTGLYTITLTDAVGCTIDTTITIGNIIYGCTDPTACNYDPSANIDDGLCILPDGCTDPSACNYNALAVCDDGSCLTSFGCIDTLACNYNPLANCDDGSCLTSFGCTDINAVNYDSNATCDDGSCIPCVYGCTDLTSSNYDVTATCDDGSCLYLPGCTDSIACNYNPLAVADDSSCCFAINTIIQLGQDIDGESAGDHSGNSVSISGDGSVVAIGAKYNDGNGTDAGHVRIYKNIAGSWVQIGDDIDGEAAGDYSGNVSLSFTGSIVAIGANANDGVNGSNSGHVRVYNFDGTSWNQMGQDIDGETSWDFSGVSVSLSNDGNTVAIGAESNGYDFTGHVRIYNFDGTYWNQLGGDIDGEDVFNYSGVSVSLASDGQRVAIGAPGNSGTGGYESGHVRIYNFDGTYWNQLGDDIDGEASSDFSGCSVSLSGSGDTVAIGAMFHDGNATNSGHVRIYIWDGSSWIQLGNDIEGGLNYQQIGESVSISSDGTIVAVGAPAEYAPNNAGYAGLYNFDGTTWNQIGIDIDGETDGDKFGYFVSLSSDGETFAVGAPDNNNDIGHVRVYNWIANSSCNGCTDSTAVNYDANALCDDGSCIYCIYGCTDPTAFNYDANAICDDGSCIPFTYGCMDPTAANYNPTVTIDDGSCEYAGCTDSTACNYDATATIDDGSCDLPDGCTDPAAGNYDASALCDDGSCIYISNCGADVTGLFVSDIIDDRVVLNWDNMNTYDANGVQICRIDKLRIKYRALGTTTWLWVAMGDPSGYDANGFCNSTQVTSKTRFQLDMNTTYEWWMRAWYCSGEASNWAEGPQFTTADECPVVGNLSVDPFTNPNNGVSRATFSWDDSNGPYVFCRIKMRVDSISNPVAADWVNVGGGSVPYGTFTAIKYGLTPGESYRAQAKGHCDPTGHPAYNSLTWTPLIFWTQPSLRLDGEAAITNLDVYPNPSRDVFNISFTSESVQDLRVRVLNVVGEEIVSEELQQYIGEYTKQIDLTTNAKGIYFLEIETKSGVVNKKLILQ